MKTLKMSDYSLYDSTLVSHVYYVYFESISNKVENKYKYKYSFQSR